MRICIVSGIFPPDIGGPATHLFNLCTKLNNIGHKIHVISFGNEYVDFPFPVQKISRKIPPPIRLLVAFIKIMKLHKKIDIIFTLGGPWDSGIPGLLAKIGLRKPMVTKVTGDIAWERARIKDLIEDDIEQFQKKKYSVMIEFFRWIQRFVVRGADRVIVPSNYLKSVVIGWGIPSHKIDIVYNAVKEEDLAIAVSQEEARRQLGINGIANKIILTIARLTPWKGIDSVIKILPRLDSDIQLMVVGDGPYIPRLRDFACSMDVKERIIFAGRIPYNKINLYLRAADIFVLPSGYEGLPHTILEAMVVGVPVVATDIGGVPELIEHDKEGFLFKPDNLSDLQKSINSLLEDRRTSLRLIKNAREKVKQFNVGILTEKIIHILYSVTNKSSTIHA